ncbi:MAG: PH domain-containing protein [Deltaproteobacteria bacterium]|nr:PH domain-containing protein [Myxococcales bacterium]MDP3212908.1 PH domain-containing protein [Deltaproteobacteria bacterium]
MESNEFLPQIQSRSPTDSFRAHTWSAMVLVGWLVGGPLIAWLVGAPMPVGLAGMFAPAIMLAILHTRALRVSARGIEVVYSLRRPRLVPWSDIRALYVASSRELVFSGWRFFPFPLRESTNSATTEGHVCVRHAGGRFYFPPADLDGFFAAVRVHAPALSYREGPAILFKEPPL